MMIAETIYVLCELETTPQIEFRTKASQSCVQRAAVAIISSHCGYVLRIIL